MKTRHYLVVLGALLLAGCSQPTAKAGTIEAINHTQWAINHFSVDGQSGIDIIGPYQGGGGGCCYGVPAKWRPGMTVRVDWQSGEASTDDFPGYQDRAKYLAWEKKIDESNRNHSKIVPVPDYSGQKTCGITVHFMPCDEVKVTTSCANYGHPEHPIKEPLKMPEPKDCPK
ncbi:DUF3304 domain-containing protein [Serratia sp. NPDC087055]|uniref:DUF3304 domain-containing protein n=1 Tax=Serratia sp. NPDC087055 TaxID=3364516 RepID=UPI00384BB9AA